MSVGAAISLSFQPRSRDACKHSHEHVSNSNWSSDSVVIHHSVTPCSPSTDKATDVSNSSGSRDRNLSVLQNNAERSVQARFSRHVTESPKVVAQKLAKAGVPISPFTVEAHQQSLPKAFDTQFGYCRVYPAYALDCLEVMGIDLDMHRDGFAVYLEMQRRIRGQ